MNEMPDAQHEDPTALWQKCGAVPADALRDTRVQLHWALQIPAAVGRNLAEKQPLDGHTNFGWLEERRAFASHWSASEPYVSAALQVAGFKVLLDHDNGSETFELTGRTAGEGFNWLTEQIGAVGGSLTGSLAGYDGIPAHPVKDAGEQFSPDEAALAEWQAWFENADRLLHKLCTAFDYASDVRTWPQGLDMAAVIAFSGDTDPTSGKTIRIGFSPGNAAWYDEPFWHCTPSGVELDESSLPEVRGGEWRTGSGSPSAVLRCAAITAPENAADQAAVVQGWAESALVGCRKLLGY